MLSVDQAYPRPSRSVVDAAGGAAAGTRPSRSVVDAAGGAAAPAAADGARRGPSAVRRATTATNDGASTQKPPASPTVATSTPATAGPRMRAVLNAAALRAIPFGRSSLPVMSTTNDCRAGRSN